MTLVEELPEDEAGFSSKPSASDEADVTRAEAGTSVEHSEAQLPRDAEEDERLLVMARGAKERGNAHFKAGELPEALECYSEAIELAAPTEVEEVGVFFANRAAVFARMGQHQAVCDDCDAALQRQPGYVKALLRRAHAREALDQVRVRVRVRVRIRLRVRVRVKRLGLGLGLGLGLRFGLSEP